MIGRVVERYPRNQVVATTLREVHSTTTTVGSGGVGERHECTSPVWTLQRSESRWERRRAT